MTNLTIDRITELEKKMLSSAEHLLFGQGGEMSDAEFDEFMDGVNAASESAKELILSKIEEKKFAKLRTTVKNSILAMMLMHGQGKGLIRVNNDDLISFTDTFFLTVLGILINEEVV